MKRLTKEEIAQIKQLVNQKSSLNKISKKMELNKTTVYYHYFKFKGPTMRKMKLAFSSDFEKGEVLGIFAGDGTMWHSGPRKSYNYYITVCCGKNRKYANYVRALFSKVFGKNFYFDMDKTKYNVRVSSKDIQLFLKSELSFNEHKKSPTVKIKYFNNRTISFLFGFLKGLIDTDGCIIKQNNSFRVIYYSTSTRMISQVYTLLTTLKFESKIRRHWPKISISPQGSLIIPNYKANVLTVKHKDSLQLIRLLKPFKAIKYNLI